MGLQDGVVVLKERYAHSGLTVGIDHGCGVVTLYYHLDNYGNVEVGQKIKKGTPVGTLGMSGYASGYHLHWEMRIYDIQVDPMQWTKHDFKDPQCHPGSIGIHLISISKNCGLPPNCFRALMIKP